MNIIADMTASVWKVLAEVGEQVSAGAELAILESMKMEIPVQSPISGVVTAVNTAEGGHVTEGDVIFEIEPAES